MDELKEKMVKGGFMTQDGNTYTRCNGNGYIERFHFYKSGSWKHYIQTRIIKDLIYYPLQYLWGWIPNKINDYNMSGCRTLQEWDKGMGEKVKPFLGFVFIYPEPLGTSISIFWWKHLYKCKSK